jgi:transposase-like protein
MKKVPAPKVVTTLEASESPLPAEIQEALGELVGAAMEGLLALSVGVGLGVVHELMEREVAEVVGTKGKHDPDRTAKRHGHERGSMTLGGRRVPVSRPRMRTADDEHELPVTTYGYFADRDPLTRAVMDRMLAGVSTRRFARVGEPVGTEVEQDSSSTSKSTVSELFIERTRTALSELMGRRLDDMRLAVMMLDGLEIADRTHVVALGISTEGVKIPLGLWEGSTENAALARALLADLVDRGLDPEQAILFVIDGGKALRRAIKDVFGEHALVHRCHRHKERNVCDLLPERDRPAVQARIRAAWALTNPELAEQRLELLASEFDRTWPDAAGSLREGLPETLTQMRLGITGQLAKTLCSTNPCESMIEIVRYTQRNVKRWGRRHAQALDRRRHAPSRAAVPTDHRLPRPRQARDRDRASHHPRCYEPPRPPGDRRASYRLTINPGDRRRSSTTIRTTSAADRAWLCVLARTKRGHRAGPPRAGSADEAFGCWRIRRPGARLSEWTVRAPATVRYCV